MFAPSSSDVTPSVTSTVIDGTPASDRPSTAIATPPRGASPGGLVHQGQPGRSAQVELETAAR